MQKRCNTNASGSGGDSGGGGDGVDIIKMTTTQGVGIEENISKNKHGPKLDR